MATGIGSAFKIYENEFNAGRIEYESQNANAFNAASLGTIRLRSEMLEGQYSKRAFFLNTSGLVNRRDVTSVTAGTVVSLAQEEEISVKLNRYSLVEQTLDSFRKIGHSPQEMSFIVGQQFAKAEMLEKLNSGLSAFVGATGNVGATAASDQTTGTITHLAMIEAMKLFGDRGADLKAIVMHSKVAFDLLKQSIADKVEMIAGQAIIAGSIQTFGRPIIVTDSSELVSSATYYTLFLTDGAIDVVDSEERGLLSEPVGGLKNLVGRVQTEYAYNLGLRGYKYVTGSGANPDAAAVRLGTNWTKVATSIKDTGGVRLATL